MTLTLDLTPELETRLKSQAERRGLDPQTYVRKLIEADTPFDVEAQRKSNDPTLKLLAQWAEEDRTDDPEELARRDREFEQLMTAMNQNRLDSDGPNARIPFP